MTKVLTLPFPAVNTFGNMYNEMKYILREFLLDICEVIILKTRIFVAPQASC